MCSYVCVLVCMYMCTYVYVCVCMLVSTGVTRMYVQSKCVYMYTSTHVSDRNWRYKFEVPRPAKHIHSKNREEHARGGSALL